MMRNIHPIERLTAFSLVRRLGQRYAQLAHLGGAWALFLAVALPGLVLSHAIVYDWLAYGLVAAVGLLWLVVILDKPHIGLVTLLILTSSIIFEGSLPVINVVGRIHLMDLILGFLLLLIFLKPAVNLEFTFVRTPLDLPVILFAVSSIVACFTAVRFGVDFILTVPEARYIIFYLTFFLVTNLVRDGHALRWLFVALFIIATVTAVVTIAQAAVGSSVQLMPGMVGSVNVADQEFVGINRVEAPGLVLVQFMLVAGFALLVMGRGKIPPLVHAGILGLLLLSVILPFYRGIWVAALFSLALVFPVLSPGRKAGLIVALLVAIPALLITGSVLESFGGKVGTYTVALVTRAESLVSGAAINNQGDTWNNRTEEVQDAMKSISRYPVFGIGYENQYRTAGRFRNDRGTYVHNGYVSVLLKMGLVGFIPFIWMVSVFLMRGYRLWKQVRHPFFQAVALGLTLGFTGLLIANISDPRMVGNWKWTAVFGVVMGINEVIYRLYGAEHPPELVSTRRLYS